MKGMKDTMADIALTSVGNDREKLIQLIYQEIGLEEEEANDIIERIEKGDEFIIRHIPSERIKVIEEIFIQNEIYVNEIKDIDINGESSVIKDFKFTNRTRKIYQPVFPSNVISRLGREDTMRVLKDIEKIAAEEEGYYNEIVELNKKLNHERDMEKSIRRHVSGIARIVIWLGIISGAIIGTAMLPVIMTIIMAIVALIVMNLTVKKFDLKIHKEKNDAKADEYALKNVYPLEEKMNEVIMLRKELFYGGKYDWALNVIGKEMFYSECIKDLYNLIKSRRADNLKEALNKYDDALYKARMEELQKATKAAAETSAIEARKQTEKMKQIERNTNDTAWAAEISAVLNYGTYENTRKINNKLR